MPVSVGIRAFRPASSFCNVGYGRSPAIRHVSYRQTLLRHEVVLYNCFTVSYDRLIKPAVPSAVSYRGIGCMVQPLSGEASGKQYQT
jgi:hypothetical protein